MKNGRHIAVVLAALFMILGIPALLLADAGAILSPRHAESVTCASPAVPDQPAGDFLVLINREKHPDTLPAWSDFFLEGEAGAVTEDISCMVVQGDPAGFQLAERYRAILAAGQMRIRQENPILVVSRMENGLFDVVILSRDTADTFRFSTAYDSPGVAVLEEKGDAP